MNPLIKKLVIGAATLAIACAPLAASAQDWHQNGNHGPNNHGHYQQRGNGHYSGRPVYHPVYHRWNEGYYGLAPAGFHGYYHNGGWYHHRRYQGGIAIYF
jgi:hypothetical protein